MLPRCVAVWLLAASPALAGGSPENAVLIVDPSNPVSLRVANRYQALRDLPDRNVLYFAPNPGSYAGFQGTVQPAFLGALEQLGIEDHIDYVVLSAGSGFQVAAGGLLTDACWPVNRLAVTTPFAVARTWPSVPVGASTQTPNGYYANSDLALAFDARTRWASGVPSASGTRLFIAAVLGYEGPNGNTLAEILASLERSAAVDGARPAGTVYFCQTNDSARSAPRHGFYPAAAAAIGALGLPAQHLFANLPPAGSHCMGVMTGLADPAIDAAGLTLLPGSFADHLTSYAGTFDGGGQTKMSRWIANGASGTSGTVEEPCNYPGKFPHARLHVHYAQGLSLGEAWLRSLGYLPFQQLLLGDPLCRPFAFLPQPGVASLPAGAAAGTIAIQPIGTTPHPNAAIARFEVLIDGRSLGETAPGGTLALDTTALADGWHELRVLAWDDTGVRSTGRAILPFSTSNFGRDATLAVTPAAGDLSTRFDFAVLGSGGTVAEARLFQGSRVVAARAGNGRLSVFGRTLGADRSRLQLEVEFADGRLARSAPVVVDVADSAGLPGQVAPLASSYTKPARNDAAVVVELPASFDAQLADASWTIVAGPLQGTILGGSGPYRVVQPAPGASGADPLVFRVTTPAGTSSDATVTIRWTAPAACPTPANECTANPNSTGLPATMTSSGSTRIGANDFRVAAYDLPPFAFGVFYYGANATQLPFGDGFRCVASPVIRLGVQQASLFGDVERALDFAAPPLSSGPGAITGGSTWRFQFWYRNPAAGGAGFNTSDALAVTFCP